jgi:hypothetical protein
MLALDLQIATYIIKNANILDQVRKFFCLPESLIILPHFLPNVISGHFPEAFLPLIFYTLD